MTPDEIFALMRGPVVLLEVRYRTKEPIRTGWQKLTLADMTPEYLASFNGNTNIGVSLGRASRKICTIDCDQKQRATEFAKLNPWSRTTLFSWANRGANFWVEIEGDYPKGAKIKTKDGQPWGEWRADGMQTIISGVHEKGNQYQTSNGPPIKIKFNDIVWPDDVIPPWAEPEPEPQPEPPKGRDIDAELTAKCGPAFHITKKGTLVVNQSYFVQRICRENLVFFDYDENRYFRYNAENGAWETVAQGIIKELVRSEWERLTRLFNEPALAFKDSAALLHSLVTGIESHSGRTKIFKRLKNIIHCANGMLKVSGDGSWELMPFSPAYYARNPIPIAWNPDATCPKLDALLSFALPPEDISLFWRWFGSVLLTGNAAQRILLFIGKAATGKSTIAEVVEMVVGLTNCTALRTRLLHERFEIGRLFGYSLLTAKDVPGDFLEEDGAQALKKLVGHDYTPGEAKGSMVSVPVYGDFDCMITCNERLLVSLQGETDVGAWKRRLMMLEFLNVIPEEDRIENYSQALFAQEASGILRKAVAGAITHLAELKARGNFAETATQKARVDHLLAESESVRYFVAERVYRVRGGPGLSTEELVSAYIDYCNDRDWRPYGIKQAERALPDLMMSIHGIHVGAHIMRNGKRARGYPHVALTQASQSHDDQSKNTTDNDQSS